LVLAAADFAAAAPPPQPAVRSDTAAPKRGARPHWWVGKQVGALQAAWGRPSEILKGRPTRRLTSVRYVLRPYRQGDPGFLVEFHVNRRGRIVSADSIMVVNGEDWRDRPHQMTL
jgi:hypothetical protein